MADPVLCLIEAHRAAFTSIGAMPFAGRHRAAVRDRLKTVADCLARAEMEVWLALSSDAAMDRFMLRYAPRGRGGDESRPRLLVLQPSDMPSLEP